LHARGPGVGSPRIPVFIGVHEISGATAEAIADAHTRDVAVQGEYAARLCAHVQPGQTLVSSSVVALCRERRFTDVGDVSLKGIPQPVRAHVVVEGR
jgi:class 3 adenylate cyclase